MKKLLSLKMKVKAFTLIEMLAALSLFSLAMLLIISLLFINSKILSNRSESSDSLTGTLLSQSVRSILNNSFSITKENDNNFTAYSFDGKKYRFRFTEKNFIIEEMKNGPREFNFKFIKKIFCGAKNTGKRYAFHMVIEMESMSLDKWYLLGYRKEEGKL